MERGRERKKEINTQCIYIEREMIDKGAVGRETCTSSGTKLFTLLVLSCFCLFVGGGVVGRV